MEVRTPDDIFLTLDVSGTVDGLPFMPEMFVFCGKQFRVSGRAVTTCISGGDWPRGFRTNDIVTLENIRCSGAAHDNCQKGCVIFWHEAWLRKAENPILTDADLRGAERLRTRLNTKTSLNTYYCQASELPKITEVLSRWERLAKYFAGLRAGNFSVLQMAKSIGIWLFWKFHRLFFGVSARGHRDATPAENLNLQPGEWIEVKLIEDIIDTLDEKGQNRGLSFSPGMSLLCGERYRVKARIDKIILDGTGKMRQLRNTVCLDGVTCGCAYMGFGASGCARCEFQYWREAWLRRSN